NTPRSSSKAILSFVGTWLKNVWTRNHGSCFGTVTCTMDDSPLWHAGGLIPEARSRQWKRLSETSGLR
ncbi:MAG: hypothetical protein K6T59_16465, partial [Bryobacteraceae bacterium]|nr:hypothetical protein [Bryobacteraceae bacterium]